MIMELTPPPKKKNKIKMNNENKELKAHYTPPPLNRLGFP